MPKHVLIYEKRNKTLELKKKKKQSKRTANLFGAYIIL